MPLIKSKSKKAMSENIDSEMEAGKPEKEALAIAYNIKRRAAKKKMAMGGEIEESDMMNAARTDDEMDAKRENRANIDDEDKDELMMAEGGSVAEMIMRKKRMMAEGGDVDIQENGNEDLNLEDQLSYDAARKKTYFDDSQLEDQPEDSNLHGDELSDEDAHDMVDIIRRKIKSKRSI